MAQSGPRGSPDTDARNAIPACNSAAATLEPDGTETKDPLTVKSTVVFAACAEADCAIVERDVDCNPFCILRKKRADAVDGAYDRQSGLIQKNRSD